MIPGFFYLEMSQNSQQFEMNNLLNRFLKNSFHVASNDPLANVTVTGLIEFTEGSIHFDKKWDKLHKSVKSIQKEFGINPLCISTGVLSILWKDKQYHFPIKLMEAWLKIDKISGVVKVASSEDDLINPFLIHFFEREFSINLPQKMEYLQKLLDQYETIQLDLEKKYIGNFHPHRFEIIRELEALIECQEYSKSLMQLNGLGENHEQPKLELSKNNLISVDPDQFNVLEKIKHENCVVQGPPGTGKSQVIINLLGKFLEKGKSAVVVSEKRVALDVIEKKMSALNLSRFCYTSTNHFSNTNFIEELKKEWKQIEIQANIKKDYNPVSHFHYQELQNLLDLLHQPKLANGESILEFIHKINPNSIDQEQGFKSDLPNMNEWEVLKPSFQFLQSNNLINLLAQIKTELIDRKFLELIESKIGDWKIAIWKLANNKDIFYFEDIYRLARQSVVFSKFSSTVFKKYGAEFYGKSNIQKKLIKIRKELKEIKLNYELKQEENNHWQNIPNEEECNHLIEVFKKRGFLKKIQQKNEWKKWTKSSFLNPIDCLNARLAQIALIKQKHQVLLNLNSLNIESEEDLEQIIQLNKTISEEEFQQYKKLTTQEIEFYSVNHITINHLISDFKLFFRFDDSVNLLTYFSQLEKSIFKLLEQVNRLKLNSKHVSLLSKHFEDVETIEKHIIASTWSKLKIDFPSISDFSWDQFHNKLQKVIEIENKESLELVHYIHSQQKETFEKYHSILLTPSVKLDQTQKQFKQALKEGKKILVKEFGKSRNHLSIRQLMESPAKTWIQLLKPIWLLSPTRMSACFPLAQNLFELAIFDEASQIPLEHALGTLQRSQRVLIAGDPQQMSPSNYFSSVSESIDLLHQASYYMPGVFLSYHYRSRHPELIAFSNEHFYQNRLSAFQDALFLSNPIEFHYIQNALYNERVNRVEAKEVAKFISSKLTENSSLGIVAFSESQLEEIFEHLSLHAKNLLQERIDQDDIFFKSLENVQGDECEELIVSFGYGISEKEGKFNLRFGPLNQSNGHKRLNVLLTRAKRKIHFFASVKSIDFKPSSNESVDLMRKWFVKIESNPNSSISESQIVYLPEIVSKNKNILTISTLYSIYKSRNWHIKVDNYKNVTY